MANDFEALQAKLRTLRGPEMMKTQRKALRAVGDFVEAALVSNTPVKAGTDGGVLEPGELRDSIKARVSVPSDEAVAAGKEARVVIGPTGYLRKLVAHDVEYGHTNAKSKTGSSTPPHPFIRPVAESSESEAIAIYTEVVTADVQKVMGS